MRELALTEIGNVSGGNLFGSGDDDLVLDTVNAIRIVGRTIGTGTGFDIIPLLAGGITAVISGSDVNSGGGIVGDVVEGAVEGAIDALADSVLGEGESPVDVDLEVNVINPELNPVWSMENVTEFEDIWTDPQGTTGYTDFDTNRTWLDFGSDGTVDALILGSTYGSTVVLTPDY